MTDDRRFVRHHEINFSGTLAPAGMEILAAGGLCAPVMSATFDIYSQHNFTRPRPHRWRDRLRAWFSWEKDWWPTLGYPLHPVRYYFPKVAVQRGGITFNRDS